MSVTEVLRLVPGSIIELHKNADAELDLFVNDRQIGSGTAVKVNENFGIKLTFLGGPTERIAAVQHGGATGRQGDQSDGDANKLAEQLIAGQI